MRDTTRLFLMVGEAALIAVVGFVLLLAPILFVARSKPDSRSAIEILVAMTVLVPDIAAASWMFRKLQTFYTRREARAVSTAFALFAPISLSISIAVSPITGGYAGILAGAWSPLIGAFLGAALLTAFLSFVVCALVLKVTRLTVSVEQSD